LKYMRSRFPQLAARIMFAPYLIFWGIQKVRREE
ncbi:MAG TPA: pantothenate kinase, partial [Cyanobacteria bacterium UBA11049]|nr:pantothenate kinase [Cyanobacteria bacterium UBA11049]